MKELQERRRFRNYIYSKVTVVILLLLVLFVGRSVWGVYQKNKIASYHYNQSQENLEELRARQVEISSSVERLSSERGIEEEIRRTLPVAREGEGVIVILDQEADVEVAGDNELPANRDSWWHRLWDLF